jgi:hypothetical protein
VVPDCLPQVHQLWALPLQITLALCILFTVVGRASLAGVICILAFIIVQWVVVRNVRRLQQKLLAAKDSRMQVMTEVRALPPHSPVSPTTKACTLAPTHILPTSQVLNAIKMIKLHAWEGFFRSKVDASRKHEMAVLYCVTGARLLSSRLS